MSRLWLAACVLAAAGGVVLGWWLHSVPAPAAPALPIALPPLTLPATHVPTLKPPAGAPPLTVVAEHVEFISEAGPPNPETWAKAKEERSPRLRVRFAGDKFLSQTEVGWQGRFFCESQTAAGDWAVLIGAPLDLRLSRAEIAPAGEAAAQHPAPALADTALEAALRRSALAWEAEAAYGRRLGRSRVWWALGPFYRQPDDPRERRELGISARLRVEWVRARAKL